MKFHSSLGAIAMGLLLYGSSSLAVIPAGMEKRISEADEPQLQAIENEAQQLLGQNKITRGDYIKIRDQFIPARRKVLAVQPTQPQAKQNINTAPGYAMLGEGTGGKNEAQLKIMKAALQGLLTLDPNIYNIPPNFAVQVQNKINEVDKEIAARAGPLPPPPADAEGAVRDVMDQIQKTAAQIKQTYQPIKNQLAPATTQKMQQTVNAVAAITQ